jgi:hypothetical protein
MAATPLPASSGAPLADTSVCPRCGAGLRCGMVAGDAECWCVKLPHVMPLRSSSTADSGAAATDTPPGASCYCPACLKQIIDERTQAAARP